MRNTYALYAVSDEPEAGPDDGQKGIATPSPACPLCLGTMWEFVESRGVRPCGCRLKERRNKLLADARIPKLYVDSTLKNYQPSREAPSQLRAYNYAYSLVRDYPLVDRGILFMGESGVGKTHLSVAIMRALIEKGIECRFYEYRSLLKEIQGSYNPNTNTSEMELLAPLFECEVIVLDELGAAKPTQWVQDTIGLIINSRYNEKKLTILTTNYLDDRLTPIDETLEDRIGARLRSRLYQMCKTVLIEGEDYRRRLDDQIV